MMNRARLTVSAIIIAFVILIVFALSVPHTRDVDLEALTSGAAVSVPAVTVLDSYRKGTHTITGSVEAPDACTAVSASATLLTEEAGTEKILVALSVEHDSGVCLELPTAIDFETKIEAPADLPITVTVNGAPASSTPL